MSTGIGIDLGAHSIKVVELRATEKGAVVRKAIHLDRAALEARGVDPAVRADLAALLKKEMAAAGIPTRNVVLGISGKDSIIRYTHVPPVPAWRLKKIMDYEVSEVAEKIGETLASDFRVLPVTREGDDDQAIIIGLAKEPALDGILDDLRKSGITVSKAMPAPLALFSAYSVFGKKVDLENPDDEIVVAIDIGAESLNIAVLLNGNLVFARSAGFGGKSFSEAIARDLGIELDRAEKLKIKGGTLEPGGGSRREETVSPLRTAAMQLVSTIQSSLKIVRSQVGVAIGEPTRYVLLGGGSTLPGLNTYLQNSLGRPVEVFLPAVQPAAGLGDDAAKVFASAPGNFAVALGLAAAGVRREGFELSLLPVRYRERRRFWDRTFYLYMAASFLVVFLAMRLVQGYMELDSATDWKKHLADRKGFFEAKKSEMLQKAAANAEVRERANRLLLEADVGPFQAFLLDFLAVKVGTELKITSCRLLIGLEKDSEQPVYLFQIDGQADNASQKALERIEGLRAALSAEPRVARLEVVSTRPAGIWYEFQMQVYPTYQSHR